MSDSIDASGVSAAPPASADGELHTNVIYRFANVEFDLAHGELRVSGKPVAAEPRPLRLLAVLLNHVNEVVTKEELFDAVWNGRPTVEHVLTNAVSKLRSALGEEAAQRLVTVPRTGYRLAGPLQRLVARAADFAAAAGQPVPGADGYLLERPLGQPRPAQPAHVWLARHAKLWQLHVFKFASDGAQLASLKREFTLYRVLNQELGPRDDFARVVGSNFVAAPFFLKCEFGGASLLEWSAGPALLPMPVAERVALFLQIARAVAAAHSVGVLHKDLKPANVLIDAVGGNGERPAWQIRLTDFGSGRLLDPARLAALGVTALGLTQAQEAGSDSRSGTLLYFAPELIGGQAPTVQSDVYALGIVLYQLLAGDFSRPLSTGWARDIADPLLADDIAAATEGQPAKRLASAAELVERLQTLAARHREQAAREAAAKLAAAERAELLRRRARRPWAWAAFAALGLGLATTLGFFLRSQQALAEARQQAERAQSINDFLTGDVLQSADATRLGSDQPATMAQVLRRASAGAAERFKGQPRTEASVRLQLGDVFSRLGDGMSSEAEYRRAIELLAPVAAAADVQLLTARFAMADLLALRTRLAESQAQLDAAEQALALAPALLQANAPLERAALSARQNYLSARQRYPEAVLPAQRLVVLADAAPGAGSAGHLFNRFIARASLADKYFHAGRLAEAEAVCVELLRLPYSAEAIGAVHFERTRIVLARVRLAMGRSDGVESELIAARDALVRRLGPNDAHAATGSMELGNLYLQRAEFDRAADAFRVAHAAYLGSAGASNTNTRIAALNLAITDLLAGRPAQALPVLTRERPQFVADAGAEDNPVVQAIDFYRARAFNDLKLGARALPVLATLSPVKLNQGEPAPDWEWRLQAERGRALLITDRRAEGAALLRTAIERMAALKSPEWLLRGYRSELNGVDRAH